MSVSLASFSVVSCWEEAGPEPFCISLNPEPNPLLQVSKPKLGPQRADVRREFLPEPFLQLPGGDVDLIRAWRSPAGLTLSNDHCTAVRKFPLPQELKVSD